jgi:anti-sigma factor RsiW
MPITDSIGISAEERERMNQRLQRGIGGDGSRTLRNWKHENFAQAIAYLSEQAALGKGGEDAYVAAGFTRHRQNHVRLMRREHVAKRIEWLRFERAAAAAAARMPISKVIEGLHGRGVERFEDFVERNAAGAVCVRDFSSCVPVEVAIGALQMVSRGFGIKITIGG